MSAPHSQTAHDALTLVLRLAVEDENTHAPETQLVMARWKPALDAMLAGKSRDEAIALVSETAPTVNIPEGHRQVIRDAVLEEAAQVVERMKTGHKHRDNEREDAHYTVSAQRIRALKNAEPRSGGQDFTTTTPPQGGPAGEHCEATAPNTTHEWPWIQGNVSIPAIILQKCEVWIGTAAHAGIQTHYEDGADTPNRTALLKLHAELRALLNTPFQRNAP